MNAQTLSRLADYSRQIAVITSIIAIWTITYAFATHGQIGYQLGQYLNGRQTTHTLAIYMVTLTLVMVGYCSAMRRQFSQSGGLLTIVAVTALYAWCQFSFGRTPHPIMLAIAGPAVFHIVAGRLLQASLHRSSVAEVVENSDAAPESPAERQPVIAKSGRELVAGAA